MPLIHIVCSNCKERNSVEKCEWENCTINCNCGKCLGKCCERIVEGLSEQESTNLDSKASELTPRIVYNCAHCGIRVRLMESNDRDVCEDCFRIRPSVVTGSKSKCDFCLKEYPAGRQHSCEDALDAIAEKAEKLINGDRRNDYGPAKESLAAAAQMTSLILRKKLKEPITAHEFCLVMAGLKMVRETWNHKEDNLVDLIGYIKLTEQL